MAFIACMSLFTKAAFKASDYPFFFCLCVEMKKL